MDPLIRSRLTDNILEQAARRYDLRPGDLRLLDGFESFIYEFDRGDDAFILRLGHDSRRPVNLVRGEIDFINAMADGGAGVARAVGAPDGTLVQTVDDGRGGQFVATAFVKAPGITAWQAGWTPERYETYGRLLGRMHALSRDYEPRQPEWRRPEWDAATMDRTLSQLPPDETRIRKRYRDLLQTIRPLPRDRDAYGLIHYDAHEGNFFMDEDGRITLFDFDDCAYHWYAADIAIVVFYKVSMADDPEAHATEFFPAFMRGYWAENDLDRDLLAHIPLFLTLREIDLYAAIRHDLGDELDGWAARYMDGRRARIEAAIPYLDLDLPAVAG